MKTLATSFLAFLVMTGNALAAPTFVIETKITVPNPRGGNDVVTPRILVESGKPAIIEIGNLKYAMTPTAMNNGTVEVRAIITQRNPGNQNETVIAQPRLIVPLGDFAEVKVGQHVLRLKPTLAPAP